MSHDHTHEHNDHSVTPFRTLLSVIVLTGVVCVAELVVGLLSGSLALVSDSAHMLSDSTGLVISLLAMLIARRAANAHATYGYGRVEVIAAVINALTVMAMMGFIVVQAARRLGHEQHHIDTASMAAVAIVGLLVNIVAVVLLGHSQGESMNIRGAYVHVLADLFGSVAVLVAAAVVEFTGFTLADTIASGMIAALIIPRSVALLREAFGVLLERAPAQASIDEVSAWISEIPEVDSVHHVHVWTLDGRRTLCTCHLTLTRPMAEKERCAMLDRVNTVLAEHGIAHATVQIDPAQHVVHEASSCQ